MNDHEPDLTGMTFHEIAAKYGKEAAINAGIAADPDTFELTEEWFREARPAIEVMPDLVEGFERARRLREAGEAAPEGDMDRAGMDADGPRDRDGLGGGATRAGARSNERP